jgi:hypothetical protein
MIIVQLTPKQLQAFSRDLIRKHSRRTLRGKLHIALIWTVLMLTIFLLVAVKQYMCIPVLLYFFYGFLFKNISNPYYLTEYRITFENDWYIVNIDTDTYRLSYTDLRFVRKLDDGFYLSHKICLTLFIPFECVTSPSDQKTLDALFVKYNDHYRQ